MRNHLAALFLAACSAASLVAQNPPQVDSVTYPDSANWYQTFSFHFSDSDGAANMVSSQVLISSPLTGSNACYFYAGFMPNSAYLYLADDSGAYHNASLTGSSAVQQNSQCIMYAAGSSVVDNGNTRTLNLAVSFKSAYAGPKYVWATIWDGTSGPPWISYGSFTVTAPPSPDFTIAPTPGSASFNAGANATYTVSTTSTNLASLLTDPLGTSGPPIAYSVSGLPTGATATFTPPSTTAAGATYTATQTLTIATAANTPTATYPLTISAATGALNRSANVSLFVQGPCAISGQITLSGSPMAGVTVILGSGVTASTDSSGNYAFSNLAPGTNYTVTPIRGGYTFAPPSQSFNNLSGNQAASFAATAIPGVTNLSQGKTATQSSTYSGYGVTAPASFAIDGNTDGNFYHLSLSVTNSEPNAWWQLDLGSPAALNSIVLWGRTDCCASWLGDYWVFVSNTPFSPSDTPATLQNRAGTWSTHQTTYPNPAVSLAVGAVGRYLRVQLTGTTLLELAEVQAFGAPVVYSISGQTTLSGAPLSGATITLSGASAATVATDSSGNYGFTGLVPGGNYTVTPSCTGCVFTPAGQSVSNLPGAQTANFAVTIANSNLAAGKTATQSSTYTGDPASLAVDGNTDGAVPDNSVSITASGTEVSPWWQVDLGISALPYGIVVWNRTDCCASRLGDYWVFVSDTPFAANDTPATLQNRAATWSSHQTAAPSPATAIAIPGAQGRYARVQLSGANYLQLAEVQVLGKVSATRAVTQCSMSLLPPDTTS